MRHRFEPAAEPAPQARGRLRWLKWVGGIALLALLIGEGVYMWPRLHDSWRNLTEIHWGWVALSIWMAALSMSGFGRIQKQLLHAGGVRVSQRASVAVVYGATAMSLTLPAGQVFSTAFTYRQTRRWGASPIVASWQLLISGVIGTIGMLLLGVAGALLVGNQIGTQKLILTLVAVALMIWGVRYISGNPGTLKVLVRGTVRRINRLRRHPAESGMHHVDEVLRQLESVDLSKRDMLWIALWALVHRLADVACLGAACYAIGASPRWAGLLISFSVGKAVGTIPFAPGGLGYVDATLLLSLTAAAGLPSAQAVSAAFVYRVVSFIMVAIAGWIVVAFKFRGTHAGDAQFEREFERHSLLAEPLRGDSRTTPEPEPGADPRDTERPPGEPA